MSSGKRVGRSARDSKREWKSPAMAWMRCVMRTRWPSECLSASCRAENRPRDPGMAGDIDRNSPSSWCHCLRGSRRRGGEIKLRSSRSRSSRCGGSDKVRLRVSTSHPKMRLVVAQWASPFSIFFVEEGSFRCGGSPGSSGRSTSSMDDNALRITAVCCAAVCANNRKSST